MGVLFATFAAMGSLLRELGRLLKKPQYRAVFVWLIMILLVGTIFYHLVEGWSWLDSLYFSVITLSTVGYGDFSPTTTASKLFTIAYIFLGISIFVSFASMLVKERQEMRQERVKKKKQKKSA